MRLMGNPVGRMAPKANWAQTNTNMADYIRNKPDLSGFALQADLESVRGQAVANREDLDNAENDITVLQENVSNIETDIVAIKEDTPDTTLIISGKAADAKATGDSIAKVRTDLGKIADYPVETGTDGGWTWEKWKSGKAVCWGTASLGNVSVNTRWGSSEDTHPWRESAAFTQDFPAGLFNAAPQFLDITVVNSSAAVFVSRYVEDLTATNTGKFTLSRPNSMTVNNVKLGFYAIGRWKQENQVEAYVLNNALYVEGPIPESGQIESYIVDNALYVDWRDQE